MSNTLLQVCIRLFPPSSPHPPQDLPYPRPIRFFQPSLTARTKNTRLTNSLQISPAARPRAGNLSRPRSRNAPHGNASLAVRSSVRMYLPSRARLGGSLAFRGLFLARDLFLSFPSQPPPRPGPFYSHVHREIRETRAGLIASSSGCSRADAQEPAVNPGPPRHDGWARRNSSAR